MPDSPTIAPQPLRPAPIGWRLDWFRQRHGTPPAAPRHTDDAGSDHATSPPLLIAYATQTGVAEQLARDTCRALDAGGVPTRLIDFESLTVQTLGSVKCVLFVVSTTCDGDPPDMADTFSRQAMHRVAQLAHLHYGLLALGDRAYENFCAFGHNLHRWLQTSGAQTLFDPIEVDDENAGALQQWRNCVDALIQGQNIAANRPVRSRTGSGVGA